MRSIEQLSPVYESCIAGEILRLFARQSRFQCVSKHAKQIPEQQGTDLLAEMAASARLRAIAGIYGTAFFSLSLVPMASLVVPLWAIQHLNATPIWVGIAVGARSFMPLLFSIHGGALMDRLGTRRVMVWCAGITLVTFPLYVV